MGLLWSFYQYAFILFLHTGSVTSGYTLHTRCFRCSFSLNSLPKITRNHMRLLCGHVPTTMSNSAENHQKDSKRSEHDNPFQIALRTYLLSLSFSLGPSVLPLLISQTSAYLRDHHALSRAAFLRSLGRILKRELAFDGFAFSLTLAVAGGALLKKYWRAFTVWKDLLDDLCNVVDGLDPHSVNEDRRRDSNDHITTSPFAKMRVWFAQLPLNITPEKETFLSYVVSSSIGVWLLQAGTRRNRPSRPSSIQNPTLDLTLLLLVRTIDSLLQGFIVQKLSCFSPLSVKKIDKGKEKVTRPDQTQIEDNSRSQRMERSKWEIKQLFASRLDAVVFWACSARFIHLFYLLF